MIESSKSEYEEKSYSCSESENDKSEKQKKLIHKKDPMDHKRFQVLSDSKKKFLKTVKRNLMYKNQSLEKKMKNLVTVAEELVNFLLTRKSSSKKKIQNKSKKRRDRDPGRDSVRKSHSKDSNNLDQELEDPAFLTAQPSIMQGGELREHQLVGLNWLISLYEIGFNGILADEMGLGKTIQAIAFIAYLFQYKNVRRPYLIVCPNSVVSNWKKEFNKWFPELKVIKLIARREYRFDIIDKYITPGNFDVIITSYEGVNICKKELKMIQWKYIIVDEAHRLKNDQSLLSKNLRDLKTDLKLLITGTPLQNNLKELWSLLNFIMPELFDDSRIFEEYTNQEENLKLSKEEIEKKNIYLITSLHKILRPFLLKRTKAVIDKTIPPKKEIHLIVGLTKLQIGIYKNLLLKKAPTENSSKTSMMNVLMQLRKTCNHPYLFEGVEDLTLPSMGDHLYLTSGKMIVLNKLLEKLKFNHQVLIFSQFTTMLDILEDYLIYKGWDYCRIDGSTFLEDREVQIEEFSHKDSKKFVFLLSTRAGGLGINLTTADTVILYDSDWNPQVDLQAMDRAHRIGQTKCVNVYRMITENTVEEKIVERQRVKLKWDHLVILKGKVSQKKSLMNKNELKDLVQFGSNVIFKSENGTYKDEDIDQLLTRGAKRAEEMKNKIDKYMDSNAEKLFDLGINSINVYEFEGDNYLEKRKKDKKILQDKIGDKYEEIKFQKRMGKFGNIKKPERVKIIKKVELPDHHFYEQKKELERILSDEANGKELTKEEIELKKKLKSESFNDFTKNDFQQIIRCFEKYRADDYETICDILKKDDEEVERVGEYVQEMLYRAESNDEEIRLNSEDIEKINRNIKKYKEKQEKIKNSKIILDKKCKLLEDFSDLTFESAYYNKIRSKFYTKLQDKYIVYQAFKLGAHNYKEVKQKLLNHHIFRFDFYLRGIKDSLLGKRITSLVKMLENEDRFFISEKIKKKLKKKNRKKRSTSRKPPTKNNRKKNPMEIEGENNNKMNMEEKKEVARKTSLTLEKNEVIVSNKKVEEKDEKKTEQKQEIKQEIKQEKKNENKNDDSNFRSVNGNHENAYKQLSLYDALKGINPERRL